MTDSKVVDTQEERLAEALAVIAYEQPEEPWRVAHDALKGTARPLGTTQCSGDTQELAALDAALCGLASHLLRIKAFDDDNTCAAYERVVSILSALRTTHSPSEAEVEAQRDFIDYHRSQLLNYLLPTANRLKNWPTINYHIQKLHEGGATAIGALPSDKTVELLREAQRRLSQFASTTDDDLAFLARIDSHLGETK